MAHKAIIKCERFDAEWYFSDNRDYIDRQKHRTIEERYNDRAWLFSSSYRMYRDSWESAINNHGVRYTLYPTGTYTLWEGSIELELLSEGHYIFVEPFNEYLEISKVEINTDGTAIYYVNYRKLFLNLREDTRLKAIEDWIATEYPHINNFEELKNHKDDINELKEDYQKFLDGYYDPEHQKKLEEESNEVVNIDKDDEVQVENETTVENKQVSEKKIESMSSGELIAVVSVIFIVSFVLLMIATLIK